MPLFSPADVQREFFLRMDGEALIQSDFTEGIVFAEGVNAVAGGIGAGIFAVGLGFTADHPGIWQLNTGVTAAGRVFVISRPGGYTVGVGGETRFQSWLQLPFLSTALQRFTARTGFFSITLPNIITQGIGFEYDDSQAAGNWQAICGDAPGVETTVDTGIPVVAGTWYKMALNIPADGAEVEFFIDDVFVARITTNLPTGVGFSHFVNMHIMKLIGVAARNYLLDAYAVFQTTEGRE